MIWDFTNQTIGMLGGDMGLHRKIPTRLVSTDPTGNRDLVRQVWVESGKLRVEYEEGDNNMAITTFTIDPNAASLEDGKIAVRNETGGGLVAGDLVFVSGWNAATSEFLVEKAQATTNTPSLAQFVMRASLATATSGEAFKSFTLTGQNTLGSAVSDPAYLSDSVAGGFTLTKPQFAQQIAGRVAVVSATIGEIEFLLLADSDSGFVRSNPAAGEFPISGLRRDSSGNLEVEIDDVAV